MHQSFNNEEPLPMGATLKQVSSTPLLSPLKLPNAMDRTATPDLLAKKDFKHY